MDLQQLNKVNPIAVTVITLWIVIWRGLALWRSVKYDQKYWFLAILILQTFGILEITYLFFFCTKKLKITDLTFSNLRRFLKR